MKIQGYEQTGSGEVRITVSDGLLMLQAITDGIIRCVYTKKTAVDPWSPLEIRRETPEGVLRVGETETALNISTDLLCLRIEKVNGHVRWMRRADGFLLLEEGDKCLAETAVMRYTTGGEKPVVRRVKTVDGERNFVENLREIEDHKAYQGKLTFYLKEKEKIHGLGQGEEGIYNYRGQVQYLYQHNMRIPVPFFVSDRHYGILADCGSLMVWENTENATSLWMDTVEQLDYYFIYGEDLDAIIAGFRKFTGKAAMLPKWAFGYVQSRERYKNQEELAAVAERYRAIGIGLDCVVQDWKTWPADDWGCKIVDKERYPDLKAATDRIHDLHVHTMVSVWPNMNYGTQDYTEMEETGYLLLDLATYDAFDEDARSLYWKQCERELFAGGFDSWWCDSTEPFSGPDWNGAQMREPRERFELVGGEHKKYLGPERANLYALAHAKGIYENQRRACPNRRVLNLTRSGYAGIQKYGTMLWSGDICARWDVLRKQIAEGLNMGMSGLPYWTFDIGGFFVVHENWQARGCECNTDPSMKWFWKGDYEQGLEDYGFRELYVRWLEFGAFLPMFRSHGTDVPREIWNFGEPGDEFYDAIAETIAGRYRLLPYIYSMAGKTALHDATMMRSLLFDFPEDLTACSMDTEYMFGDSLLISPVTEPLYYGRNNTAIETTGTWQVYLPMGCGWYDYYTDQYFDGGQSVTAAAPMNRIPVFVKAGSVIPKEHAIRWADQVPETPFELHIYPTRDGKAQTTYYEDAGDDYGYEEGVYNEIRITWNQSEKQLSMGRAEYRFGGSIIGRDVQITVHGQVQRHFVIRYRGEGGAWDVI